MQHVQPETAEANAYRVLSPEENVAPPFGPKYPALPGLAKWRRLANGRELTAEESKAYGAAVLESIRALQRLELIGRGAELTHKPPTFAQALTGNYPRATVPETHKVEGKMQPCAKGQLGWKGSQHNPDNWNVAQRAAYERAMEETRAARAAAEAKAAAPVEPAQTEPEPVEPVATIQPEPVSSPVVEPVDAKPEPVAVLSGLTVADFKKGQRVLHSWTGKTATVVRPVKSRRVVTIEFDGGSDWYDANPAYLEPLDGKAETATAETVEPVETKPEPCEPEAAPSDCAVEQPSEPNPWEDGGPLCERCDCCGEVLEPGQLGLCDSCQGASDTAAAPTEPNQLHPLALLATLRAMRRANPHRSAIPAARILAERSKAAGRVPLPDAGEPYRLPGRMVAQPAPSCEGVAARWVKVSFTSKRARHQFLCWVSTAIGPQNWRATGETAEEFAIAPECADTLECYLVERKVKGVRIAKRGRIAATPESVPSPVVATPEPEAPAPIPVPVEPADDLPEEDRASIEREWQEKAERPRKPALPRIASLMASTAALPAYVPSRVALPVRIAA